MTMNPGKIVMMMLTANVLFLPSGLSEQIIYKSTKDESATIPLPECDTVKIESKNSCGDNSFETELQVTWNNYSLNASSLFHCSCGRYPGLHPFLYREKDLLPLTQLEISRETLQASPNCEMVNPGPKFQTLKGRTLTISSEEEMEWNLYISGNCNTYQTWKTATFATGAAAILFLAATLSLAVYILLKKQYTKRLRGQEAMAGTPQEMQNYYEIVDPRMPSATYGETEDAIYDNPEVLWDIGSNRAFETNQRSPTGYGGMYEIPQYMQNGTKSAYEDVTDRRQNRDHMYVNLPGIRS